MCLHQMGHGHGFNTRILQIAAIDEQIESCERELLGSGWVKLIKLTAEEEKLVQLYVRSFKLERLRTVYSIKEFDRMCNACTNDILAQETLVNNNEARNSVLQQIAIGRT